MALIVDPFRRKLDYNVCIQTIAKHRPCSL